MNYQRIEMQGDMESDGWVYLLSNFVPILLFFTDNRVSYRNRTELLLTILHQENAGSIFLFNLRFITSLCHCNAKNMNFCEKSSLAVLVSVSISYISIIFLSFFQIIMISLLLLTQPSLMICKYLTHSDEKNSIIDESKKNYNSCSSLVKSPRIHNLFYENISNVDELDEEIFNHVEGSNRFSRKIIVKGFLYTQERSSNSLESLTPKDYIFVGKELKQVVNSPYISQSGSVFKILAFASNLLTSVKQ